ncbi:MAG: hypothetical protein ACJ76S_06755 [Solirubrobacteraceae bacterium]
MPTLGVVAVCLALGCVSLLLPYTLSGDEWCWLIWGRGVGRLALDTTGCTVWKPLPVLFTTVISQAGDAAPMLWLALVRTSWLLALVLAYRVGTRLAGRPAGLVAALGLLLIPNPNADWISYFRHASSEPLIVALILAAVDRHLAAHRLQALGLGCLAALGRPEAWVIVLAYGALVWRTDPGRRLATVAVVAVVPLLWLGGGLWGGRGPLSAGHKPAVTAANAPQRAAAPRAARSRKHADERPVAPGGGSTHKPPGLRSIAAWPLFAGLAVAFTASQLVVLPIALLALAALIRAVLAVRRNGRGTDRVTAFLGAGVLGWIAVQVAAAVVGFPVTPRFLFGPAAVISVLGAVGLVEMARALRGKVRVGVTVALVALIVAFAIPRARALPAHLEGADAWGDWPSVISALRRAQAQGVLRRCGGTIYAVGVRGKQAREIAWRLDLPMRAIHRLPAGVPGIKRAVVVTGDYAITNPAGAPVGVDARRGWRQLASAGKWSVFAVGCRTRG